MGVQKEPYFTFWGPRNLTKTVTNERSQHRLASRSDRSGGLFNLLVVTYAEVIIRIARNNYSGRQKSQ